MASPQYSNSSPIESRARSPRRHSTHSDLKKVDESDVVQGRIFWLPPKEELPPRAVRRAHGKGAIEEGIYNHPIIIISRPADQSHIVHCQIITSFQGKRLHEIYPKSNEFHASRRSWYLPISPSPDHPDAASKKTRKRFPTLDLADGALLRWDSYANLRHLYKIDWKYLRTYANPDTPEQDDFHFDHDSMTRLLAKTKVLTNYEPGPQYRKRSMSRLELRPAPVDIRGSNTTRESRPRSPKSDADVALSPISSEYSELSPSTPSDFGRTLENDKPNITRPPKAPPDRTFIIRKILPWLLLWPWELIKICLWFRRHNNKSRHE